MRWLIAALVAALLSVSCVVTPDQAPCHTDSECLELCVHPDFDDGKCDGGPES